MTFTPGGPNEETTQLRVLRDSILELNETYTLALQLTPASVAAGAQLGLKNQAKVTIINDDGKITMLFSKLID